PASVTNLSRGTRLRSSAQAYVERRAPPEVNVERGDAVIVRPERRLPSPAQLVRRARLQALDDDLLRTARGSGIKDEIEAFFVAECSCDQHVGISSAGQDRPGEDRLARTDDEGLAKISGLHEAAFDSPDVRQIRPLRVAGDA